MSTRYRIVFTGELVPGKPTREIIEAFATRFQVREETAQDIVLSHNRTVLKHDLDEARALRYSAALKKVGLLVSVEPLQYEMSPALAIEQEPSIDLRQTEAMLTPAELITEPALAPVSVPGGQRCPKCRADAVSPLTGVCQACGVVVERYLARQVAAANGAGNPYAPPTADLTATAPAPAGGEALRAPRRVPAGNAWHWIAAGFAAFRDAPLPWVLATLLFALLNGLTRAAEALASAPGSLAGGIGGAAIGVLSFILGPMILGGIMIGLENRRRGGAFGIQHLVAGFTVRPGRLALLGLAYLVLILGTMVMVGVIVGVGGAIDAFMPDGAPPTDPFTAGLAVLSQPLTWVGIGLGIAALIGVWMMSSFAPALVALNAQTPLQALTQSLLGCVHNIPGWPGVLAQPVPARGSGLTRADPGHLYRRPDRPAWGAGGHDRAGGLRHRHDRTLGPDPGRPGRVHLRRLSRPLLPLRHPEMPVPPARSDGVEMPPPAPPQPADAALPESALDYWTGRYAQAIGTAQTGGRPFVVVSLGGERFAIALDDLDEVACIASGIALPHVSPLVLGLANVRGELLPLLDTAALLGVGGGYRLGIANRTLVIRDRRGRRTGLPVDGIESVEELHPDAFQAAGAAEAAAPIQRGGVGEHRGLALSRLDVTPLREGNFSHF